MLKYKLGKRFGNALCPVSVHKCMHGIRQLFSFGCRRKMRKRCGKMRVRLRPKAFRADIAEIHDARFPRKRLRPHPLIIRQIIQDTRQSGGTQLVKGTACRRNRKIAAVHDRR